MDFHKPFPSTLTEEELAQSFQAYHEEFTDLLLLKIIPEFKDMLVRLNKAVTCRQYQFALDDIESAEEHLRDLVANGPKDPLIEITLEESEIQENFTFEDEIEFAPELSDSGVDAEGYRHNEDGTKEFVGQTFEEIDAEIADLQDSSVNN